jgi:hypothetical protein
MKLCHLLKFAIMLIAIIALITVSGTAYAIYVLRPKPTVHLESPATYKYGRTEVIASMQNCSDPSKHKYICAIPKTLLILRQNDGSVGSIKKPPMIINVIK